MIALALWFILAVPHWEPAPELDPSVLEIQHGGETWLCVRETDLRKWESEN